MGPRSPAPTSKIAVNYFNDCYLISGLKAASILDLRRDPVQVLRENPVNYVFVAEAQPIFSRRAREAIRQEPRRFAEIFRVPETETAIYQYQPNAFP